MFFKFLSGTGMHNGVQYQLGPVSDILPFNPQGSGEPGGLYYTTKEHLPKFYGFGSRVAFLTTAPNAQVYAEPCGTKWKADTLIVHDIQPLESCSLWNDVGFCIDMLVQDGYLLRCVPPHLRTPRVIMLAVEQCGSALQYVQYEDQTEEMCLKAISDNIHAYQFVAPHLRTHKVMMSAVKQCGMMLREVKEENKTWKMCLAAVRENGMALQHVPLWLHYDKLLRVAIRSHPMAIQFVKYQTISLCKLALFLTPKCEQHINSDILALIKHKATLQSKHMTDNQPPVLLLGHDLQ